MSGAVVDVELDGFEAVRGRLRALSDADLDDVAYNVGALVISQTQRRIHELKTAPDGAAWAPWSERYAETRHDNQSLLESEGYLLGSIDQQPAGRGEVGVGSNLEYARAMQFGLDMSIISTRAHVVVPARPYLGLSDDDGREVVDLIIRYFDDLVEGDRR